MPHIELRQKAGTRSAGDLKLLIQDATYKYLLTSSAKEIRVSTYLESECPEVQESYAEFYVSDDCVFDAEILDLIPGSKSKRKIELPAAMHEGEQLTVLIERQLRAGEKLPDIIKPAN